MSWVYGHWKYFIPFSAGTVFIRQNLTSVDVRFWRVEKHILLIFLRIYRLPKPTNGTPKEWLNVTTTWGHMVMSSLLRWADNRCCRGILQPFTFAHQLTSVPYWITLDFTVWEGGYLWYKVLYTAKSFVYLAVHDLEIKFILLQCLKKINIFS